MKKVPDLTRAHDIEYLEGVIRGYPGLCKRLLENPEEAVKMAAKTAIDWDYIVPDEGLLVLDNFMAAAVRVRKQLLLEQQQQQEMQKWEEQKQKDIIERYRGAFE